MRFVWCNRYSLRRERLPGNPDHEVKSLAELPPLVGAPSNYPAVPGLDRPAVPNVAERSQKQKNGSVP